MAGRSTHRSAPAPTARVQAVINEAAALGLRPTLGEVYAGAWQIVLNGSSEWGGFGAITVGVRSGRILRTVLHHGNANAHSPRRYGRASQGARTALRDYATYLVTHGLASVCAPASWDPRLQPDSAAQRALIRAVLRAA